MIRQCGVVLCGAPIEAVFAPVSDEDFWAAISNEAEAYDFRSYAPRYLASNVLILGRILSFKMEKKILSKVRSGALDDAESPAGVYGIDRKYHENPV